MRTPPDNDRGRPGEGGPRRNITGGDTNSVTAENLALVAPTEIVAPLTEEEAWAVTNRIRQMVAIAWVEVVKAYQGRAWVVLGYESWDAYCDAEFDTRIRLPREERQEVVASLSEQGLSTRAIAAVTGVDHSTVDRDMQPGGADAPPEPRPLPADLQEFVRDNPEVVDMTADELRAAALDALDPEPAPSNVIGLDGKRYPARPRRKPAPVVKPRRHPITKTADYLAYDIERMTRRIARFIEDDRVRPNRDHPALRRLDRAADKLAVETGNLGAAIFQSDEAWDEWREKWIDAEGGAS